MRRTKSVWKGAIIISLAVTIIAVAVVVNNKIPSNDPITFLGVAKVYEDKGFSAIIRVDDFVVDPSLLSSIPDNIISPKEHFRNYCKEFVTWMMENHPDVPVTAGVITYCKGNCSSMWSLYRTLAYEYGWEIASHSRYHTRPPRNRKDYIGAVDDIEKNIRGYAVITYILPFGKSSKREVAELERSTCIRIFMSTSPFHTGDPRGAPKIWWTGFTIKISDGFLLKHLWKLMLKLFIIIAKVRKGVIIVYTHPTGYDWGNFKDLRREMNSAIDVLERENAWITTPRTLWLYEGERSSISVKMLNETSFLIISRFAPPCNLSPVPITLKFKISKGYGVKAVYLNDHPLRLCEGYLRSEGSNCYFLRGKHLYVNILPGDYKLTIYLNYLK